MKSEQAIDKKIANNEQDSKKFQRMKLRILTMFKYQNTLDNLLNFTLDCNY